MLVPATPAGSATEGNIMAGRKLTLLTGATGLLGRFLFRDISIVGVPLVLLVRPIAGESATERIRSVRTHWEESLGHRLPNPVVIVGDLREPGVGLSVVDRAWLSRRCGGIVHAAADVSFRLRADGEPRRTNIAGTRRLLALAESAGISEFHYVSTAFVCGERPGPMMEAELDCGQTFHNAYEESKCEAENAVRAATAIRSTVFRPSVIVGDSRTGYTSTYHGLYKFLDAARRLARPTRTSNGRRRVSLRLPLTGQEPRNLVPVDWVSRAIVEIVRRPAIHGQTLHLVSRRPTTVAEIHAVARDVLELDGIELSGTEPAEPTAIEAAFLAAVRDYWPYLDGDPEFDDRKTRAALPNLPPPNVGRELLSRLVRFAIADRWGRRREADARKAAVDCADYVERYFPAAAADSFLAELPLHITLGFQVRGPGGGEWHCRLRSGRVTEVTRGLNDRPEVTYHTDSETFAAVVNGRETPQDAFFARRIEIAGSVEKGLKLAALFARFVREHPYTATSEGCHAAARG
jgi:thioester reductase-like protein